MKKSTIFLLVVVYVLSFFLISLLGHSLRIYNEPEIYPEEIEVMDPDNKTTVKIDVKDPDTGELLYDYHFKFRNYENGMTMRIKAVVKPDNCTYPGVRYEKDSQDEDYNLITHDNNPDIEEGFCSITFNRDLEDFEVLSTVFYVKSTCPGVTISKTICVDFACGF